MSNRAIKIEKVGKKFSKSLKQSMYYGAQDILNSITGAIPDSTQLRKNEFWAVDDVSFEVNKGEAIGLIGPNGSGKSTLLKMLNGIFMPDAGKIELDGKVGALIEVGAGFHPMLSGKENIYINGAILGMTKKEIDKKLNDIIEFADIGDFIDSPVKHYSSGMYVRLGFSVAVHCAPDILLVDEILAVGDMNFRSKCYKKIKEIKDSGKSIVFVSHDIITVAALCDKALFISKGKMKFFGDTEEAITHYENSCFNENGKYKKDLIREKGSLEIEILEVKFYNKQKKETTTFEMGEQLSVQIKYIAQKEISSPIFAIEIFSPSGLRCFGIDMKMDNFDMGTVSKGEGIVEFQYDALNLKRGKYYLVVGVYDTEGLLAYDVHKREAHPFSIISDYRYHGTFYMPHQWKILKK